MTSVASTSSVTGSGAVVTQPMVAFTFRDVEDAAPTRDEAFEVAKSTNGASGAAVDSAINLVHPTKDERLALIRNSRKNEAT